jgi:hypothetical protein
MIAGLFVSKNSRSYIIKKIIFNEQASSCLFAKDMETTFNQVTWKR